MADQDDDIDSLDHILRLINSNDEQNRASNNVNHASSFSVGGRISSVVDPEFRPPVIQTPQTGASNLNLYYQSPLPNMVSSTMTNPSYGNMINPNNQFMGVQVGQVQNPTTNQPTRLIGGPVLSNQLPVSANLSVPSGTASFSVHGQPSSFSDIAKRSATMSGFAQNPSYIMSNTLNEYGPPVGHDPLRGRGYMPAQTSNAPNTSRAQQPISNYPMGPAPMNPDAQNPVRSSSASSRPMGPAPMGPVPIHYATKSIPTSASVVYRSAISPPPPPPPLPSESSEVQPQSAARSSSVTSSRPVSVPPPIQTSSSRPSVPSISPPLDQIVTPNGQTSSDKQPSSSMTSSGRIPKIAPTKSPSSKDNYDAMKLVELQTRYREYEGDLNNSNRRLQSIERSLNDLTRTAKGRNIEHDPEFRKKKDEQKKCKEDSQRIRSRMKKIEEKALTKFNHKLISQPDNRTQSRRAKMSTTSRRDPSSSSSNSSRERVTKGPYLSLEDDKTWCEICDQHFDSLAQYCDHLHSRDHKRCMPKCEPWRDPIKSGELLSVEKTYYQFKSICSRLSNEMSGNTFDLRDLDRVLSPMIEDRDKVLKERHLERERGNLKPKEDPLFKYKGYNYIMPITGFFCTLCSCSLCDYIDIEKHMKSYEHTRAFAKSVSLNISHETAFRTKLAKSYREAFGAPKKQSPTKKSPTKRPEPESVRSKPKSAEPIPSTSNASHVNPDSPIHKESSARILSAPRATVTVINLPTPTATSIVTTTASVSVAASTSADTATSAPSASKTTGATTTTTTVHQYKKATSHIVDQHEAVVEKFPNTTPEPRSRKSSPERTAQKSSDNEPPRKKPSTEIVPLGNMGKTAALKRLKNTKRPPKSKPIIETDDDSDFDIDERSSSKRRRHSTPVIRDEDDNKTTDNIAAEAADDDEDTIKDDSSDSDVQFLQEIHLDRGDPDSPFPDLELSVTANIHVSALKDKRLSMPTSVKLKRLNLDDYKDMLMDSASLWVRVNQILTKKEPKQLARELREPIETEPIYFDAEGNTIPVEIDDDDDDDDGVNKNKDIDNNKDKGKGKDDDRNKDKGKDNEKNKDKNKDEEKKGENEEKKGENEDDFRQHMLSLEDFFIEK